MQNKPYIVTGRLIRGALRYATVQGARRAVDRLDAEYGAAAHTYSHEDWGRSVTRDGETV